MGGGTKRNHSDARGRNRLFCWFLLVPDVSWVKWCVHKVKDLVGRSQDCGFREALVPPDGLRWSYLLPLN